jgi:hypothetical protein
MSERYVMRAGSTLLASILSATLFVATELSAQLPPPPTIPSDAAGLEVLRTIHQRYATTRFRTFTFTQRTTHPDGRVEWWWEAQSMPSKSRTDVSPFANKNMQIYRNDSAYVFQNGQLARKSEGLAATMWVLLDMFYIPPEQTAAALGRRGFDMTKVHERQHNGRPVIVVGALAGDTTSAQFWLDKEHLYAVRLTTSRGGRRVTEFGKHVFMSGGWVETEIKAYGPDNRLTLLEEYFDLKVNVPLPANFHEPDMYRAPPWVEKPPVPGR